MENKLVFANTCLFGAAKFPMIKDYIEKYGEAIGFEILSMFDLEGFEAELSRATDALSSVPISFHGPVYCAEHSAPKGSAEYEETMYHVKKTFHYARLLKSRHFTMHLNNREVPAEEKETMLKNALENYKELQEMFADFGCAIYVENTGTIEQRNMLLDQAEFTDLCRREKFDVLIDIGHANANGWDIEKLVCDLAGQIKAYHLHNNDGRRDLHNRILDGIIPFQSVMGTILSKTPDAELIIEYIRPEFAQTALFEDIEKVQSIVKSQTKADRQRG
ncbi:MAG: sugar phosphate isomerase/epimerase [Schwartzia sp.]|nr:sugar phosphate isomerase/epimerase [Schwartzia sp. (in: firmicutes)]